MRWSSRSRSQSASAVSKSPSSAALAPVLALLVASTWLGSLSAVATYQIPERGWATLTHYDLPDQYVASCGCVGDVTNHPVTAINRLAYGSNTSFGPSCGICAKVTLLSTPLAPPPPPPGQPGWGDGIYFTDQDVSSGKAPSVTVKVVDLCPGVGGPWCNATEEAGNSLESYLHFDLAWPSKAISKRFFPGDHDYGVWNVSYEIVSCTTWSGYGDAAALGSDWDQETSACCPANPWPSGTEVTCPPYYDTVGPNAVTAPNTSNPLSKGKHSQANSAASTGHLMTWPASGPPTPPVPVMLLGSEDDQEYVLERGSTYRLKDVAANLGWGLPPLLAGLGVGLF
ncbi:hypothetical protein IE53DRAFT_386212 [Violaceomyces palustris]|uniref:Uncharacterized protein n=1 Tax=Violaceomyces palustris TaxID=1673888 RepID=A0ACD0P021_9BASI|nr:hypothetical protein IE53DRAFT_386212 [Violaceomyces palustris]